MLSSVSGRGCLEITVLGLVWSIIVTILFLIFDFGLSVSITVYVHLLSSFFANTFIIQQLNNLKKGIDV